MGVFDQAARFAAQADPDTVVGRVLAATKTPLRFQEWADPRTFPQPGGSDRTADLVAVLAEEGKIDEPWLLVLEFQTRHDPGKLDVTLEEVARLRLHARHGPARQGKYRVLTGLVYLQGRCPEPALDMTLLEGFGTRHVALVWNIADDIATTQLASVEAEQVSWGMLFWVPLMAGADDETVIAHWCKLALAVEDRRRRGDLGKIALVFAELIGRYAAWAKGLEGYDMTESNVVNRWIEEACSQARIEEARENLVRVLRRRFPAVLTEDVTAAIAAQPSLDLLHDWFDAAITAFSADEFLAVLRR
jgi:hypothetical protein